MLDCERNLGRVHEIEACFRVNLSGEIVKWKVVLFNCCFYTVQLDNKTAMTCAMLLAISACVQCCVLFFMSSDQTSLLEFLHILTTNHKLVFAPVNNEPDFIAGLCHWLLVMGTHKSLAASENNSPNLGKKSEGKDVRLYHYTNTAVKHRACAKRSTLVARAPISRAKFGIKPKVTTAFTQHKWQKLTFRTWAFFRWPETGKETLVLDH